MSPEPLDEGVRRRMRRQSRRDTKLELQIRRRLHAMGYRFRVDFRPESSLRTRGDIVFTRKKVVIFVDGCFWHGCPLHASTPKNNADWWREKLAANVARDTRSRSALESLGWHVVRVWGHEDLDDAVGHVLASLEPRGQPARNSE